MLGRNAYHSGLGSGPTLIRYTMRTIRSSSGSTLHTVSAALVVTLIYASLIVVARQTSVFWLLFGQ